MRKIAGLIIVLFMAMCISLKADIQTDLNKSLYMSIGSAAAKAAGLPVDEVASIATALGSGDFKTAFFDLANWATDSALDLIPVYGQAKFAADMVVNFGNVLMTYLKNQVIQSAWKAFVNLDDTTRKEWLNGEYVPEIDELYGIRLVNKEEMRSMFRKAWNEYEKHQKQAKIYMDAMAKIAKLIKRAKSRLAPSLFYPNDGSKVKLNSKIEIWNAKNNYFKIVLSLPDGKTSTKFIKNSDLNSKTTSFTLREFKGINWDDYFKNNPDGINVTLNITAGIYDTTNLMKTLMPDMVTPKEHLLKIEDLNGKIFEKFQFSLKVLSEEISCSGQISGIFYYDYSASNGLSSTDSSDVDANIRYRCNPKTKKAQLDFLDDGTHLSGKCDDNGVGLFSVPLGMGSLVLYLKPACKPVRLSFYSTGSYSQQTEIINEDGSSSFITVTLSNLRGSLQ